jgi:hypothetical protein
MDQAAKLNHWEIMEGHLKENYQICFKCQSIKAKGGRNKENHQINVKFLNHKAFNQSKNLNHQ